MDGRLGKRVCRGHCVFAGIQTQRKGLSKLPVYTVDIDPGKESTTGLRKVSRSHPVMLDEGVDVDVVVVSWRALYDTGREGCALQLPTPDGQCVCVFAKRCAAGLVGGGGRGRHFTVHMSHSAYRIWTG